MLGTIRRRGGDSLLVASEFGLLCLEDRVIDLKVWISLSDGLAADWEADTQPVKQMGR